MASLKVGLLSSRLHDVRFFVVRDPLRNWYTLKQISATYTFHPNEINTVLKRLGSMNIALAKLLYLRPFLPARRCA